MKEIRGEHYNHSISTQQKKWVEFGGVKLLEKLWIALSTLSSTMDEKKIYIVNCIVESW